MAFANNDGAALVGSPPSGEECRYLPELEIVLIYDLMARSGIIPAESGAGFKVSVFNPCSSRHLPETQQAVRQLLKSAGYALEPLLYEGKQVQCCSYGGQISIASPAYNSWDNLLTGLLDASFSISGMAFQDVWNVDLERLRDCCIHVVGKAGTLIPFCAYNLTGSAGKALYRS